MDNPKSRIENIVVQDFENEVLIYDLSLNKAYCLNSTSARVYQLCNGKNSIADIANLLSKQLKEPITEDFVWLALDGLKKENLLEESESFEINFNGFNRRQVVKKIGFASLVALPIIASVVAPSAIHAQSGGVGLLGACTSTSQCQSGLNCLTCLDNGQVPCTSPQFCCVNGSSGYNQGTSACFLNNISCQTQANNCCSGIIISNGPDSCGPTIQSCTCA